MAARHAPITGEDLMKSILIALSLALSGAAFAADGPSCPAQASEKKLAGAAKNSFIKKCAKDSCNAQVAEKKLAGAAKDSFTKKCIADNTMG
jgi:hypothetical protein